MIPAAQDVLPADINSVLHFVGYGPTPDDCIMIDSSGQLAPHHLYAVCINVGDS
jgi:hypothetical protein